MQQAEEMLKVAEKQREETLSEVTQKLHGLRSQINQKLELHAPREKEAEVMTAEVLILNRNLNFTGFF